MRHDPMTAVGANSYRRIAWLLKDAGWAVGTDRLQRIWRREGLKVPSKQKPRSRLCSVMGHQAGQRCGLFVAALALKALGAAGCG
jgi:hypothetical protein